MLTWFRETAPIRLKTKVAFGLQAALVMLAGLSAAMVPVAHISVLVSLGIAGSALAISVVTGFLMARAISEPYVATVVRMEALAAGDLTSPIAYTSYRDCVGRMTVAMHTFKEGALAKREAERRADETRSSADGERSRREAERAAHAGEIEAAINGLAVALSELAEGNVAYRIEMPFKGDADRLRIDFNASMEKLQQVLATVGANAQGIRIGSKEVAVAADELAKRTEKQAASLEETAAALDGITVTVRKTAEGALHARQVVATAKGDAETSGAVAQDAIEAMKGIATSSRQIGQIIGVIDEIAFQTNLLALNAGVEAARAGEAGRGFAVVASEVRALAQRSAEAAKEIKTLISNSASHVDHGVELVIETGNALTRIVNHVAEISAVVTAIAESAQEQSVGLQEVNVAVTQMDQMTQQNAAMVEESTAASHSMMQEAEGLTKILGRFNLGDEPKVVEFAPVRTQGKTSVSKAAAVRPAISGGHGAARGSAVRKAAPVEAEKGWEEF